MKYCRKGLLFIHIEAKAFDYGLRIVHTNERVSLLSNNVQLCKYLGIRLIDQRARVRLAGKKDVIVYACTEGK